MALGQIYDDSQDYGGADPDPWDWPIGAPPPALPRYNTTPSWQDATNPPSPGDPYWAEWIAANPDYRGQGYTGPTMAPVPPAAPAPGQGGGGAPAGSIASIGQMDPAAVFRFDPTQAQSFLGDAPAAPGLPGLPTWRTPPAFVEPDYDSLMAGDKGFQATLGTGRGQMEASAAARGVLNGGGTLKDINQWGQNMGAAFVRDARDRAVNNYLLNYQTQYVDPYKYAYQGALDTFNGGMNIWSGNTDIWRTKGQLGQQANRDAFEQQYRPFSDLWDRRLTLALN